MQTEGYQIVPKGSGKGMDYLSVQVRSLCDKISRGN